jgi:anti-sigma regulatory factor (Ser/Thr protein kinase)
VTTHNALIYRGADEFSARAAGFVGEGLSHDERVLVIAAPEKLETLRAAVGDGSDITFLAADRTYSPQARAIRVAMEYFDRQPGRRTRMVAEQDLSRRNDLEIAAYMRLEASGNAVFRGRPLTLLCAYDADTVSEQVLHSCRQVHDGLLEGDRLVTNPAYVDPAAFLAASAAVVEPPVSASTLECQGLGDLPKGRSLVEVEAARTGMARRAVEDLVLAVNEVVTNALRHGRTPARLSVYREGGALVCHVHDSGPGIPDAFAGFFPPSTETLGGRGLWLARQLCDSVEVVSDPTGCHVRLLMLPRH